MANVKWELQGREFFQCNCAYSCPCQFNDLPTHGNCRSAGAIDIETGFHGDTRLDGLRIAMIATWPGAIHEGHGQCVPIIDERATPEQRNALLRITSGQDTEPGATFFAVFATTFDTVHEPVFAQIDFDVDVDKRTARIGVPGWIDARGEPILNPVTGDEHRVRLTLPQGFEFDTCEVGRGWAEVKGPLTVSLADSHAHFARLHMTETGVVH